MEIERQQLKDRSINYVQVTLYAESGCNVDDGEYQLVLHGFMGGLDISAAGGVDDISLIKDCIENNLDKLEIDGFCAVDIILRESGEWEDVFWHKYYEIERSVTSYA